MEKILILRFSSIGDIVLTSPVVRHLHNAHTEIHFLVKNKFRETIQHHPLIRKIHSFEKDPMEIAEALMAENFDCVIDLQKNLRSRRIRRALGKPAGKLNKFNIRKWKMVRFKCRKRSVPHITERYLAAAGFTASQYDRQGLDFYLSEKDREALKKLPAVHAEGFIGLVIGAAHGTKCFPTDKNISLCQKLDYPVVILGGPAERAAGEAIAAVCRGLAFNACGLFSLCESAAVIEKAQLVISPDTGLMHIAAALKKPLISLWGNTVPEFGMSPCYPKGMESLYSIEEVRNLPCRPCSKIGYDVCPKKHFQCMKLQDESAIAAKALQMISKDKD